MANKKKTQREFLNEILAQYDLTDEHRKFLEGRRVALDKKSGKSAGKPTATQVANEGIKSAIVEGMAEDVEYSITDLIKSIPACEDLTNQKVSALVRQLKDSGIVIRTEKGGKATFRLAD